MDEFLLHKLAKAGEVRELKAAIKKLGRSAIDKRDEWDQTPLHVGCFEGHFDITKLLLKSKPNINARDKNNWTPLHAAASGLTSDHIKICELLLDKGADANAKTNDGSTPLHYFVRMDPSKSLIQFHKVLEKMAEGKTEKEKMRMVNAINRHGESPLHHAAIKGREQSALFLHHLGADINLQNRYGETALVVAIRAVRPEMVKLFLSLGSDPFIPSDTGLPIELARNTGIEEIVNLITQYTQVTPQTRERGNSIHQSSKTPRGSTSDSGGWEIDKSHDNDDDIESVKADEDEYSDDEQDDSYEDSDESEDGEDSSDEGKTTSGAFGSFDRSTTLSSTADRTEEESSDAEPASSSFGFGFSVPDEDAESPSSSPRGTGENQSHEGKTEAPPNPSSKADASKQAGVIDISEPVEKKTVPCALCQTALVHDLTIPKPKGKNKNKEKAPETNNETEKEPVATQHPVAKRFHFHARAPALWDMTIADEATPREMKSPANKGWRFRGTFLSNSNPYNEPWDINYNRLSLDLCVIVGTSKSHSKENVKKTELSSPRYGSKQEANSPVGEKCFFVKALIHIPVASAQSQGQIQEGEGEGLTWGVWVKVSEEIFKFIVMTWEKEGREKDEKSKRELGTRLPSYPKETLGVKVKINIQPVGKRPVLTVLDNHPLAAQQKNGITKKKLLQIVHEATQQ